MDSLDTKIINTFPGKIVRKDLTSLMKKGSNVPTFVLEYLLGMYCSTDDEEVINKGIEKIRRVLSENYVKPDESEKIKSKIRENGEYTIIDKVSVYLDEYVDEYIALFTNLQVRRFVIDRDIVVANTKLLTSGVWCIVRVAYTPRSDEDEDYDDEDMFSKKKKTKAPKGKYYSPFSIVSLKPIQMPNLNLDEILNARASFSRDEWIALILRSAGYEPTQLTEKQQLHYLERLVPLIEKNYNLVELGPRGTGKSHIYQEMSPYAILMSGGHTTVTNLFYDLRSHRVGLVGHWDCIAFDEVAGMANYDLEAIQILKNYMANGAFARGHDSVMADASICFEGNINDSIENMMKTTNLFNPFPASFNSDSAFFDRIHYYLPGWETPKLRSSILTEKYGMITDCLSEFCREMRKKDFTGVVSQYFDLNHEFNQRDTIAVIKTVSGLAKLIHPDGKMTKEDVRKLLEYAIEGRRRVKEQLKKMAGVEFIDTNLGYIDPDDNSETVVSLPEIVTSSLVPSDSMPAGHVFAIGKSYYNGEVAVYRLENKIIKGNAKMETQGVPTAMALKDCINAAWVYFQENAKKVIDASHLSTHDYLLYYADPQEKGISDEVSLAEYIGLCSALSETPVIASTVIVGDIKLSGTMMPLTSVEDIIRVSINAGAGRILLPMDSFNEYNKISDSLKDQIQAVFYINPIDAAKKALNVF